MLNDIDKTMDNENVNDVQELEHENNEFDEVEIEGEEETTDELEEEPEDLKERAQSQIDRLKREKQELKEELKALRKDNKPTKQTSKGDKSESDRFDKIEMKLAGITQPSEQEFVLDYMKLKGLNVDEALSTGFVQSSLRTMREQAKSENASAPVSNRVSQTQSDMTLKKAYQEYKKTGTIIDGLSHQQTMKLMKMIKSTE